MKTAGLPVMDVFLESVQHSMAGQGFPLGFSRQPRMLALLVTIDIYNMPAMFHYKTLARYADFSEDRVQARSSDAKIGNDRGSTLIVIKQKVYRIDVPTRYWCFKGSVKVRSCFLC